MYHPPNSEISIFLASYNSLICTMKRENPKSIIIGLDHNLDFLKADRHSTTYDFIQNNLNFGLIPTITRPTRITNSMATLIDNIIVSQNLCGSYVSSILVNDTSDHLPMVCVLSSLMTAKRGPMVVKCRDTRVQNMNSLKKQLSDHDWTEELTDLSPSTNMEKIHTMLSSMINHCLPYKECTIKYRHIQREPWLSTGLKLSIDRNKKLYAKMLRQECSPEKYKAYNCVFHKTIRHAKNKFYHDKCHEYQSQTKKLWRLINEISGKKNDKSGLIEYLKIDGVNEYNSQNISNTFAKYFAEVGKKFASKINLPKRHVHDYLKLLQSHQTSLFLSPTCQQEIKRIVSSLPSKSSSGHDNISNVLLKEIIDQILQVLVEVFNKSMTHCEFPTIMKLAEVVPLYKGKEHYLETNC